MEALLCTNTALLASPQPVSPSHAAAQHRPPALSPSPSASASASASRREVSLGNGLRCAGPDWTEPSSFVGVANKTDAAAPVARKSRASAGAGGEEACFWAIHGVDGGTVDESVSVPVTPSEQSLVVVNSVSDEVLSNTLPSKLDFEQMPTYIIYGTGAFLAGWILSAVVSAIDSIPWLLPQILEIVGLGYTIWFSAQYPLFKENRDELFVKVDDIKRRIVGSSEE